MGGCGVGVAFIENAAVADDQQGIGVDAAVSGEGVGVDGLPVEGGRVGLPVGGWPVFGAGRGHDKPQQGQQDLFHLELTQ